MRHKTLLDTARGMQDSEYAEFGIGTQIKSGASRVGSGVRRFAGMAGAKAPGLVSGIKKIGGKALGGIKKVPSLAKGFGKKVQTRFRGGMS